MSLVTTTNLVVNGDGESGGAATDFSHSVAPNGWTVTGAFTGVLYSIGGAADLNTADSAAVNGGNIYFAGGPNNTFSSASQWIDVSSYANSIDSGTVSYDASGDFGGWASQDDAITMVVKFYAADHTTLLGSVSLGDIEAAPRGGITELLFREAMGSVPVGTRAVHVELDAQAYGNYNDGYADNISLKLTTPGAVIVTATHNYTPDDVSNSSGVTFQGAADATAAFSAAQFAAGQIDPTGTITGDSHVNKVNIDAATTHTFDASGLHFQNWTTGTDVFRINGATGDNTITDSTTDDLIVTGSGNDTIYATSGGNDTLQTGGGSDQIWFGAAMTSADKVDGGDGSDVVILDGDYATHSLKFGASSLKNVEGVSLMSGHSYSLITNDANVAAGQTLEFSGQTLSASDRMIVNGAAETDGKLWFIGGAGDDVLTGGAQADTFDLTKGGTDRVFGGGGDDEFTFADKLEKADKIDGGAGDDVVALSGDYSVPIKFNADTMVNVEHLNLLGAYNYSISLRDANIGAGQTLTVNAAGTGPGGTHLTFEDASETDGNLAVIGGAGDDSIITGHGNDVITGGGGIDTLTGGLGNDTFVYRNVNESTSDFHDIIKDFDAATDKIDVTQAFQFAGPFQFQGMDGAVTTGKMSDTNFDKYLGKEASGLEAGHAMLVTGDSGNLAGHTYLVVDVNGAVGYQAGSDLVIELTGGTHLDNFSASNIIGPTGP